MRTQFLNQKSQVFAGASPFEVSAFVNRHVGCHGLRLNRVKTGAAALNHCKAGSIDLCRLSYGAEARVLSAGLADIYHLQFILRGHCRYLSGAKSLDLAAGHALVINPEEPIDLVYSEDCEKFIVRIPAAMFNEVCSEHRWCKPNEYIRFSQQPYRFEDVDSLLQLLSLLCQEAESGLATPQMLQHYNRVVSTKLMTMLRHDVRLAEPAAHAPSFERLAQYVDEHIRDDITPAELARQAHLSLRSLYLLFAKNAMTSPMDYIRRRKLEKVHAELMSPDSLLANVTAIALDYGFNHLGRFADLYKATFGVLPSDSLRSRQATM